MIERLNIENRCLQILERAKWKEKTFCPYCHSINLSKTNGQARYHCNTCNTSFSALVGTLFQNTKISLVQWYLAIILYFETKGTISARRLAKEVKVTKDTAWRILLQLNHAKMKEDSVLTNIAQELGKDDNFKNDLVSCII
jgi:transposase-like protein